MSRGGGGLFETPPAFLRTLPYHSKGFACCERSAAICSVLNERFFVGGGGGDVCIHPFH